jgi:hypothetical protein
VEAEENSCQKFRNRISAVSRTTPIYFESEGEEFGMSRDIYNCLLAYKRPKPQIFEGIMTMGNFTISKFILNTQSRHMYSRWEYELEFPYSLIFLGTRRQESSRRKCRRKKKAGERGLGKKNFISTRTAEISSKGLTTKIIEEIEEHMKSNYDDNNKRKIIE